MFLVAPDVPVRADHQHDEDREERDAPPSPAYAALPASARPSTPGMPTRPSPSARPSTWCRRRRSPGRPTVSGGGIARLRFGEIRIVMQPRRRLGGREFLEQRGRLVLVTRSAANRRRRRPSWRALVISDRSGGIALLFAARAAMSLANGDGNLSAGTPWRVAGSPVSGLIDGTVEALGASSSPGRRYSRAPSGRGTRPA